MLKFTLLALLLPQFLLAQDLEGYASQNGGTTGGEGGTTTTVSSVAALETAVDVSHDSGTRFKSLNCLHELG